jgi:hypothetical protein
MNDQKNRQRTIAILVLLGSLLALAAIWDPPEENASAPAVAP